MTRRPAVGLAAHPCPGDPRPAPVEGVREQVLEEPRVLGAGAPKLGASSAFSARILFARFWEVLRALRSPSASLSAPPDGPEASRPTPTSRRRKALRVPTARVRRIEKRGTMLLRVILSGLS